MYAVNVSEPSYLTKCEWTLNDYYHFPVSEWSTGPMVPFEGNSFSNDVTCLMHLYNCNIFHRFFFPIIELTVNQNRLRYHGLVLNRGHTIICTNDNTFYWRIYFSIIYYGQVLHIFLKAFNHHKLMKWNIVCQPTAQTSMTFCQVDLSNPFQLQLC